MASLGITDLKTVLRVPDTLDLTYLRRFNGTEGTGVTFDDLARQAATAAALFNNSLLTGYWSQYLTVSSDVETEDDTGGSGTGLKKLAELTRNNPMRSRDTAHMIPMDDYGRDLSWTYFAMRRGTNAKLLKQVRLFIEDAAVSWEVALLTRLFKSTYDAVGTGKSVPFADGGTADSSYVPPAYGGYTHLSTHTHYLRTADTAAGRDSYLAQAGLHLRHHGINGPYDLVIPEGDAADWAALDGTQTNHSGWVKPDRMGIITAGVETRAKFESGEYIGAIETDRDLFYVKPTARLSTDHAGVFKPLGLNNPFSPLRVRYEDGYPLGITLLQESPGTFPLQDMHGIMTFGVGVNNRLNGVLGYFAASGNYTDPTIS